MQVMPKNDELPPGGYSNPGSPGAYPGSPGAYPGSPVAYPGSPVAYPGMAPNQGYPPQGVPGQYPGYPQQGMPGSPPGQYPGYPPQGMPGYAAYPPGQVVPQGAFPPPSPAGVAIVSATSMAAKRKQNFICAAIFCLIGAILLGLGGVNPWKVTANPEEDFKKIQAGCQYQDFVLTSVDKQVEVPCSGPYESKSCSKKGSSNTQTCTCYGQRCVDSFVYHFKKAGDEHTKLYASEAELHTRSDKCASSVPSSKNLPEPLADLEPPCWEKISDISASEAADVYRCGTEYVDGGECVTLFDPSSSVFEAIGRNEALVTVLFGIGGAFLFLGAITVLQTMCDRKLRA